jgi:hypothetical protein
MTAVYPDRREELNAYAEDIVDISNFYGPKCYDYHKMFSILELLKHGLTERQAYPEH